MSKRPHNLLSISQINERKPNCSRLTAIEFGKEVVSAGGNKRRYVKCMCLCGKLTEVIIAKITSGHTISCGCAIKGCQKGRGVKYSVVNYSIRASYGAMIRRCYNKKDKSYVNYGAKGVVVCEQWKKSYQTFLDWALLNGWGNGLQLDKDIRGNGLLYSPETCCWVTKKENCNYRSTNRKFQFKGTNMTIPQICRQEGLDYSLIRSRIYRGASLEEALTGPRKKNKFKLSDNQSGIYKGHVGDSNNGSH